MGIVVSYRPESLAYEHFRVTANQCFPNEPFNIGLFNEMQSNHFWILQSDIEIIGYTHVKEENDHLHLSAIGIVPSERGKGYAKLLMDRIIGLAMKKGITLITLSVQTDNAPAMQLYKGYGFSEMETRYQYIVPIKSVFSTLECDTKMHAMARNADVLKNGLPSRYQLDFYLDGISCGTCLLDPDFPGCSSYTIDLPEINFIPSLHTLKEYLIPGTENLILTFTDRALRDVCDRHMFKCNYKLTDMELRVN